MLRKLAAAAALGLLLTACASTGGTADRNPPSGSNGDPSSDSPGADDSTDSNQLKFGQAFTYDDGLTVKVTKPRPFKPSEYAASKPGPAVRFTFTIVNKTGKPFDAGLFLATLQSGNKEATEIYDDQNDINGSPSTKVLNGREAQWDAAYNVKDPKDLVLEVQPDAGVTYDSAIYVS
jgi:hypothetical protein